MLCHKCSLEPFIEKCYTKSKTPQPILHQMYGETGQTDVISLDNKSNNFERGSLDKFTVSAPVVGPLYKIRIWHDDTSPAAGWHLDKVSLWDIVSCIPAINFF